MVYGCSCETEAWEMQPTGMVTWGWNGIRDCQSSWDGMGNKDVVIM